MIRFQDGDIFRQKAEALVNPVNCVGTMGKGLALEFKRRYPRNFQLYQAACRRGELRPGTVLTVPEGDRLIVNLPTKRHWRDPSRIGDVRSGLQALAEEVRAKGIKSLAVPALGAGLGGLPWEEVREVIAETLEGLEDVDITVLEPRKKG